MKETDLAWLAGIMDGEGTIGAYQATQRNRKDRPRPTRLHFVSVSISNTCPEIIERAAEIAIEVTSEVVPVYVKSVPGYGKSTMTTWTLQLKTQSQMLRVLRAILPYLIGKRTQAELIITLIESRLRHPGTPWTSSERRIVGKLKELKRYGNPQPSPSGHSSSGRLRDHEGESQQNPSHERQTPIQLKLVG